MFKPLERLKMANAHLICMVRESDRVVSGVTIRETGNTYYLVLPGKATITLSETGEGLVEYTRMERDRNWHLVKTDICVKVPRCTWTIVEPEKGVHLALYLASTREEAEDAAGNTQAAIVAA